jgi:antitoxin (DNA-binding transcriptional repressor) of toxin-antitoxin stability system
METRITATELARNLSDILNRVRYKGETFVIERNGEVLGNLTPTEELPSYTAADFVRDFGELKMPAHLGETIARARTALGPLPENPWPS